jgi:hypothetical protein
MTDLRDAARQALELLKELQGGCTDSDDGTVEALTVWCPEVIENLEAALEQPEQATGKESLQVGQEEPEGGWQSAPSPQVTQRIADMPMSEYRRGVNDGFRIGMREGRIKAEDEMRGKQEQVWLTGCPSCGMDGGCDCDEGTYNPPRREWRGLSKDESLKLWGMRSDGPSNTEITSFARAIEAALKERNV